MHELAAHALGGRMRAGWKHFLGGAAERTPVSASIARTQAHLLMLRCLRAVRCHSCPASGLWTLSFTLSFGIVNVSRLGQGLVSVSYSVLGRVRAEPLWGGWLCMPFANAPGCAGALSRAEGAGEHATATNECNDGRICARAINAIDINRTNNNNKQKSHRGLVAKYYTNYIYFPALRPTSAKRVNVSPGCPFEVKFFFRTFFSFLSACMIEIKTKKGKEGIKS